jgi:hypothetical protein
MSDTIDCDYDDDDENSNGNELIPRHQPKIPALFKDLGLGTVSTKDKFTISYAGGTLKASVKRRDGVAHTVIRNVGSGFRAMTEFNPDEMKSKEERNKYIRQAAASGQTQQQIAQQFGLSQSMVNRIVNE